MSTSPPLAAEYRGHRAYSAPVAATEPRPPKFPGWVRIAILILVSLALWAAILSPVYFYLKGI